MRKNRGTGVSPRTFPKLLLYNPLLQAVIESTFGLSFVCKNLDIDLGTMTRLDSLIVLFNMLSTHICCLSTIHNVSNPVSIRAQPLRVE